jgi:DNA-binding FadR family transcriptional regulator
MDEKKITNHKRLVRMIRQIAREMAYEVLDEHLDNYEHKEKPARKADLQ